MSNPGLIFYLYDSEARKQLLDQVVFFVIERGAAKVRDVQSPAQRVTLLVLVLPFVVTRLLHALRHHFHRLIERDFFPLRAMRAAVENVGDAMRARHQLERGRALRTQAAIRDRRCRIALNVDNLLVLQIDQLAATDRAVGADRTDNFIGAFGSRHQVDTAVGSRGFVQAENVAGLHLFKYGPIKRREGIFRHGATNMTQKSVARVMRSCGQGLIPGAIAFGIRTKGVLRAAKSREHPEVQDRSWLRLEQLPARWRSARLTLSRATRNDRPIAAGAD